MKARNIKLSRPPLPIMHFTRRIGTSKLAQMSMIFHRWVNALSWRCYERYIRHEKSHGRTSSPPAPETLTEERVAFPQIVMCSIPMLKRASAVIGTGGVVQITPSAESPSRDFGSTIFITGAADDRPSRRPTQPCSTIRT